MTLLDIAKNQNLRQLIVSKRDLVFKKGVTESQVFEFNKSTYTVTPILNYLNLSETIGFLLIIESDMESNLRSVMENRQNYGKILRLRFKADDTIEKRVMKSMKFLNQIYGASRLHIEQVLKNQANQEKQSLVVSGISSFALYFQICLINFNLIYFC